MVIVLLLLSYTTALSCKKFVDDDIPVNQVSKGEVYSGNVTATAALTGLYSAFNSSGFITAPISLLTGLSADELTNYDQGDQFLNKFYINRLTSSGFPLWANAYYYIYSANDIIEGVSASNGITGDVKKQLLGEARFIRAFCYFYLINLFGDVPLVTTTDYRGNRTLGRSDKQNVYKLIVQDLTEAEASLNEQYITGSALAVTAERTRVNSSAATALLARVYLYLEDWQAAETAAAKVIAHNEYYELVNLDQVFLLNSKEAIWQLPPYSAGSNTVEGDIYIPTTGPNNGGRPIAISPQLYTSFEPDDQRKIKWVQSNTFDNRLFHSPYKYKVGRNVAAPQPLSEYTMVLRLAEQFLIRAEARAHEGKILGPNSAAEDLNKIRKRAGLTGTDAVDQVSILKAIQHERQVELFIEWGHRWLDLKRTAEVNHVMSVVTPLKGGVWNSNFQLYPIPLTDLLNGPGLSGQQNSGY